VVTEFDPATSRLAATFTFRGFKLSTQDRVDVAGEIDTTKMVVVDQGSPTVKRAAAGGGGQKQGPGVDR